MSKNQLSSKRLDLHEKGILKTLQIKENKNSYGLGYKTHAQDVHILLIPFKYKIFPYKSKYYPPSSSKPILVPYVLNSIPSSSTSISGPYVSKLNPSSLPFISSPYMSPSTTSTNFILNSTTPSPQIPKQDQKRHT